MPSPSELERVDQEAQAMRDEGDALAPFSRAAPTAEGEIGVRLSPEQQLVELTKEMEQFDNGSMQLPAVGTFERKLEALINEHSIEGCGADTPDFILARFLRLQLAIFDATVRRRRHWYGEREGLIRNG